MISLAVAVGLLVLYAHLNAVAVAEGAPLTPDEVAYLRAGVNREVYREFSNRMLWPWMLRHIPALGAREQLNQQGSRYARPFAMLCWAGSSLLVGLMTTFLLRKAGAEQAEAVGGAAAALFGTLPMVRFSVVHPYLQDGFNMLVALALTFAAIAKCSPLILVPLLAVALLTSTVRALHVIFWMLAVMPENVRSITGAALWSYILVYAVVLFTPKVEKLADNPHSDVQRAASTFSTPKTGFEFALLPWAGVLGPIAVMWMLGLPDPRVVCCTVLLLLAGHAQTLLATDGYRLYQWSAPGIILLAATDIRALYAFVIGAVINVTLSTACVSMVPRRPLARRR